MMISRRTVLGALAGAAVAGGLTACGGGTRPGGGAGGSDASAWGLSGGTAEQTFRDSFESWNKGNPDKKVAIEFFANDAYKEKIRTAIGSSQAPTLIYSWSGATLADYVANGKVEDLTEHTKDVQGKLIGSVLGSGTIDGKVYALPNNNTQPVVFYGNRDVLSKAGVDAIPATFDALMDAVDKLKSAGVEVPIALAGQSLWPELMWIQYLTDRVAGPELFTAIASGETAKWEDPGMLKALGMITELAKADAFGPGFGSVVADANADAALLHTGRAGLLLQGAWVFGSFLTDAPEFVSSGKLVYGTFPTVDGGAGDKGNIVGNPANFWSVSATATDAQKKAAYAYLNEAMFNDAYTDSLITHGSVPVVTGVDDKLAKADNGEFLSFVYKLVSDAKHFQLSWDQALPSGQAQTLLTNLGQLFLQQIDAAKFAATMKAAK